MCWKCKNEIKLDGPVARSQQCPDCGADLRCCRNCTFYESGAHYDCHETISDPVSDKERSNFCDYFRLRKTFDGKKSDKAQKALDAFNSLFSI